jgi:hypothetical protein
MRWTAGSEDRSGGQRPASPWATTFASPYPSGATLKAAHGQRFTGGYPAARHQAGDASCSSRDASGRRRPSSPHWPSVPPWPRRAPRPYLVTGSCRQAAWTPTLPPVARRTEPFKEAQLRRTVHLKRAFRSYRDVWQEAHMGDEPRVRKILPRGAIRCRTAPDDTARIEMTPPGAHSRATARVRPGRVCAKTT